MAWDSRLDGWYWGESDLAYTEKKDGMVRESCLDLIPDKMWSRIRGLTVTRQLRHGGHEGIGSHVTLKLLRDWLLRRPVKLLLKRDRLKRGEAGPYVVYDRLWLRGGQTCRTTTAHHLHIHERCHF